MTAALTFISVILTSIILYIVPQGRVAYWADWRLWGVSKTQWTNIHINTGLLFLIALGLHTYYNWKPLMVYLKDRAKRFRLFTRDFNIALGITLFCLLGSYWLLPPFNWVIRLNEHFKDAGAAKYGEPPYGHAELSSLKSFAKKMNLDLNKSLTLLETAGLAVENADMNLAEIGRRYRVPPQMIYQTIQPAQITSAEVNGSSMRLADSPPPGTGNLTLAELCAQYGLAVNDVVGRLKTAGISVAQDATIKKNAAENQMSPSDLYEAIKTISR